MLHQSVAVLNWLLQGINLFTIHYISEYIVFLICIYKVTELYYGHDSEFAHNVGNVAQCGKWCTVWELAHNVGIGAQCGNWRTMWDLVHNVGNSTHTALLLAPACT